MPEKEFIKKQKKELEEKKKKLEKTLSSFAKKKSTNGFYNWQTKFPDFGEWVDKKEESADEIEEYANLLPVEYRLELKVLDIKRALEKINRGEGYGICEKCGKKITQRRLKIIPETKFCSKCK